MDSSLGLHTLPIATLQEQPLSYQQSQFAFLLSISASGQLVPHLEQLIPLLKILGNIYLTAAATSMLPDPHNMVGAPTAMPPPG
eukprot:1686477-Ditylum_brightwellii.AAC.1